MPLYQRDSDQAARYLRYACELLNRCARQSTWTIRGTLELVANRLSPTNLIGSETQSLVKVLSDAAEEIGELDQSIPDARAEVLKAIAVLRDGSNRA